MIEGVLLLFSRWLHVPLRVSLPVQTLGVMVLSIVFGILLAAHERNQLRELRQQQEEGMRQIAEWRQKLIAMPAMSDLRRQRDEYSVSGRTLTTEAAVALVEQSLRDAGVSLVSWQSRNVENASGVTTGWLLVFAGGYEGVLRFLRSMDAIPGALRVEHLQISKMQHELRVEVLLSEPVPDSPERSV
ncbi:hypothetical protein [Musicola keenii]|uniref:hypothetical protein n=1 Tax=Musicola keenii TaxID=2884250 RepID=UPI0017838071|nr:hypothetical protein [Musicola keenii]